VDSILHTSQLRDSNHSRWLVDVIVRNSVANTLQRVSTYIVNDPVLEYCLPSNYIWNPTAMIHVIIPVHNQGAWVLHLLDNMARLYALSPDDRVTLVLVDFSSTDLNVRQALERSQLPHTRYIAASGKFSRAAGVQLGADSVAAPQDIIFTCDLHLELPPQLFELVRMHTILGQTGFNPVVANLDSGAFPGQGHGAWALPGYGLFSMYKADFEAAGGLQGFGHMQEWGFEDWLMLDRVMSHGIECNRARVKGFYHCT
jgi:beta-1,4-N-acetylgalactosaminyltransferase 3